MVLVTVLLTICLLVFLNVPIAIAIALSSLFYLIVEGIPLSIVPQQMYQIIDSFPFLAFPMFMLVGSLMNAGGMSRRIFNFAESIVGHLRGGLAHVNVVASLIFSGMSGSAISDAGGLGQIEIEAMKERGYDADFAVAITAASSTIGPIVPPSVPVIIYAMAFDASVGRLFLGGFIPGILMTVALMIMIYVYSRKKDYPISPFPSFRKVFENLYRCALPMLTPVVLLGGMFTGVFTPTEAAVVAVLWSLFIGFVVHGELELGDIPRLFLEVFVRMGVVLFLLAAVGVFTWILTREQVPDYLLSFITTARISPPLFLLMANIILLLMGMVTTVTPSIILLAPIFYPLIGNLGIDPVHFGVVVILNLMIGNLTPPVGPVLFVVSTIGKVSFHRAFKATLPFILPLLVVLLLITYFPSIVLLIPNLFMP
ncbi:MAG: TRAP transporter large permease [Deltaproteobacteria bacterium]|nr:TRAP transporter large permease [Deltaproteobacteria bacterium]